MNSESIKKNTVKHLEVSADRDGQRIDNFLATHMKGVPKSALYRMIRTGQVRVNGKRCKPDRKIATGDSIRIPPVHTRESGSVIVSESVIRQIEAATLFLDDNYMVIDKPSGMAVHSGSQLPWGLIDAVRQSRPGEYIELAHRIDRETSGCIVLARNGQALRHLSCLFRNGKVVKRYLCMMDGCMKEARIIVDTPLLKTLHGGEHMMESDAEGKPSLTHFKLLQSFPDASYVEAELFTGRTHQIRAHAAHLGFPLACDERYGSKAGLKRWKKRGLKRLFLHAHELNFESVSGELITCHAPLPDTLGKVLDMISA